MASLLLFCRSTESGFDSELPRSSIVPLVLRLMLRAILQLPAYRISIRFQLGLGPVSRPGSRAAC